jgi:hypothetical protein
VIQPKEVFQSATILNENNFGSTQVSAQSKLQKQKRNTDVLRKNQ